MEKLREFKTMKEVFDYIDTTYPGWFQILLDDYTEEYPFLTKNWEEVCALNKVPRQKIILVNEYTFDDDHLVIAECLTQSGFNIRTIHEFQPCSVCKKIAIPKQQIYEQMKSKVSYDLPKEWKDKCLKCFC